VRILGLSRLVGREVLVRQPEQVRPRATGKLVLVRQRELEEFSLLAEFVIEWTVVVHLCNLN